MFNRIFVGSKYRIFLKFRFEANSKTEKMTYNIEVILLLAVLPGYGSIILENDNISGVLSGTIWGILIAKQNAEHHVVECLNRPELDFLAMP